MEVRRLMLSYLNGIQVQLSVEVLRGNLLVMKNLFVLYIVSISTASWCSPLPPLCFFPLSWKTKNKNLVQQNIHQAIYMLGSLGEQIDFSILRSEI